MAKLRPVGVDERVRRPLTVVEAAESGSHRDLLVSLRERVAKAVGDPNCPPRDLAALSRRLQEIAREIEAIDSQGQQDGIGEAAKTPDDAFNAEAL